MSTASAHLDVTDVEVAVAPNTDLQSLRRIWAVVGPMRPRILIGIFFRFLHSVALGLGFGAVVWVIVDMIGGRAMTSRWAWQIAGLMAVSLVGQILTSFLSSSFNWLSSYQAVGDLRMAILDRLRRLPMGFHLARHQGDTVSALTSDMQMIEAFLSDALPRVAQAFGLPVIIFAFMLARDTVSALVAVASIVAAAPLFLLSSRWLARLGVLRQDRQAVAAARMIEYVQGMAVIRSFNQVANGQASFDESLRHFRDTSISLVAKLVAPLMSIGVILTLGAPAVMAVAGTRYVNGSIETATIVSILVLLFSIYSPFLALLNVMELARMADASLTRIDRVMLAETLPEPAKPVAPDGFDITFDHVRFGYSPDATVLNDVSFEVPARTMTAIVGPSGSGKSTLLNVIARFWDVNGGAIRIGGVDLRDLGTPAINSLVTVVFQDVYLFAGTIFDNIAMGKEGATQAEVEAAASAAQAHEFISALPDGYQTRVGEGGATLSGGERQRVSIARALLKDAPIVLLDEATAAIDSTNERAIQLALSRLVTGRTLIVVAHKLSTIQAADQILVLDHGQLVERGTHTELLADDRLYARLWNQRRRAASWTVAPPRNSHDPDGVTDFENRNHSRSTR